MVATRIEDRQPQRGGLHRQLDAQVVEHPIFEGQRVDRRRHRRLQVLLHSAQLLPIDRGILESIYFRAAKPATAAEILSVYERQYANEPFVRLYEAGHVPDLHAVQRTNFCDIGVIAYEASGRCVVVSAIDNLVKGASGQAVQSMNILRGYPETAGLC